MPFHKGTLQCTPGNSSRMVHSRQVVAAETCPYVCDRLPYGGSSVPAPLILYSQDAVRSRTKDQAVLRSDHA